MNRKPLHTTWRINLYMTGFLIFSLAGVSSAQGTKDDSIMVRELLVIDTVDLEIYGPSNEVAFYLNGLVFLSNTKYHHSMPPEHITFGQVTSYFVPLEYVSLESSKPQFSNDPFPYDPAGTCYSRDFQIVYFTKNMEISGRRHPEKIFEMEIINGKASNYNQLSFTAGSTRYMHPAVSTDGRIMILASDLFPSHGGLDLFVVRKNESGWMTPINLGGAINTSGHEWYPFLDQHNNLYFSSTGHLGFGGYDVYFCQYTEDGWENPQNLTELVNTINDELGFSIHPNRKMAVFSSNGETENMQKEVLKLGLNNSAFVLAGIETENQDLSLLLKDMINTGYTSAEFGAASEVEVQAGFSLTALPLLSDSELEAEEPEPEPEPVEIIPVVVPIEEEPESEPVVAEAVVTEPIVAEVVVEPETEPVVEEPVVAEPVVAEPERDPNQVVFRVQILSTSKANSRATVTVAGSAYPTWEYYYKGAYRITVGEFSNLQDALALRTQCKGSGFSQSFVAAFRGDQRETDPAVFKR